MGSKTDIVVKLVLVFFISLLSFSIGTFVGKKFSDNQHQLAQLESNGGKSNASADKGHDGHGGREVASVENAHGAAVHDKKENLSDEEIAKLAEEFVADDVAPTHDAHAEAHHAEAHHDEAPHAATPHGNSHTTAAIHEKGHASEKANDRVPTSISKDSMQYNVGKFTVQIASYGTENEAIKVSSDLKTKGFNAYYISANINGKTWYRVSVGQFSTVNEAKAFRLELLDKAKVSNAFVQKIVKE